MRFFALIVISCIFPIFVHAAGSAAYVLAKYDPFVGDWLPKKTGDYVAQVFATGSNAYQANILVAFDDAESAEPVAVLRGTRSDEKSPVELLGTDWTGVIRPDCCGSPQMEISNTKTGERIQLAQYMRSNPRLRAKPPVGAIVLFADRMVDGRVILERTQGKLVSVENFKNAHVHLEFRMLSDQSAAAVTLWKKAPWIRVAASYGRSGAVPPCGSLGLLQPSVRAERAVLEWQALDIKTDNGNVTVFLNGVKVHDNVAKIFIPDGSCQIEIETDEAPVEFRNVWVMPRD